jgi:hypothetical protein
MSQTRWMLATLSLSLASAFFPGFAAEDPKYSFTFQQAGDDCRFTGDFKVPADPQIAWNVLTDYDHQSRFVQNLHYHIRQKDGNSLLVEMTAGGGFLFIRQEVKGLLRVQEDPMKSVAFDEVSHQKFDLYQGLWTLQPDGDGKDVDVSYRLQTRKNHFTPGFVTPDLLRQTSEDLMVQMRREMVRREEKEKVPPQKAAASPNLASRK